MSTDINLYNTGYSVLQFRDMVLKSAKSLKEPAVVASQNSDNAESSPALPSVLEESDGEQKIDEENLDEEGFADPNKNKDPDSLNEGKAALVEIVC